MLSTEWSTSAPRYRAVRERGPRIPLSDGQWLDCELMRPDASGRWPVLLGVHAYPMEDQFREWMPEGMTHRRGHMEAGDTAFFARRGYVHVVANIRGTGESGGFFGNLDARSILDVAQAVEWLAAQPWSNGRVGMLGVSYFAIVSQRVAALAPPSLRAIWAPFGWTDAYRDRYYHGGILSWGFMRGWLRTVDRMRPDPREADALASADSRERRLEALADPEIAAVPFLCEALERPHEGANALIARMLLERFDGPYWHERSVDYSTGIQVPAVLGGCWGTYGLHLPGAFRSWVRWQGPKRLIVGPPVYLDRPVYQYQYDQLRWFDLWLKDMDTRVLDEPRVQLSLDGTGDWRDGDAWPLPQTRFTPFHLHGGGLLCEHDPFAGSSESSFEDGPQAGGALTFTTPPLVEITELCGPIALTLYAATDDDEVLWFASLLHVDASGRERLLTRGWLRGSQRRLDEDASRPWAPAHRHVAREPVPRGEVVRYELEMRPYAIRLMPGERLALRLRCRDDERPGTDLEWIGQGHLWRPTAARLLVRHCPEHPSSLLLPIVRGNRIGTFVSGGRPGLSMT